MRKLDYISWSAYFMSIALLSSFRSKDPKTQNGACIVGSRNKIIGIGYNGLPYGCDDNDPLYWSDHDDSEYLHSKHTYVVHAEQNAIFNSTAHDLKGATIYTTQRPCNLCAAAIIQVGIFRVVYYRQKEHHHDINKAVDRMFDSAGVEILKYEHPSLNDRLFFQGLEELVTYYAGDNDGRMPSL